MMEQQSSLQLQAKLMREYYQDFSKYARGRKPERKVAWVTSFAPVEILEALDIRYIYPESYAAVIAASGKEQAPLAESERQGLCRDCCSYACCFNGSLMLKKGPRGLPPRPDVLIATNNQCNTLPNWWSTLAREYQIPLIVLDYPGESVGQAAARTYVMAQHRELCSRMEELSGNVLDEERLAELIGHSRESVRAWGRAAKLLAVRDIAPTVLFDAISFLITSRCKTETAEFFTLLAQELEEMPEADRSRPGIFWLGYPLWYHGARYLSEVTGDCRICGSNYIRWWDLDYSGEGWEEQLFRAYNYTFLNLTQESRTERLMKWIRDSGAIAAVTLHNKSCKCDFVSARRIEIPQVELEIDMIDREFLDLSRAKRQMDMLMESICLT